MTDKKQRTASKKKPRRKMILTDKNGVRGENADFSWSDDKKRRAS